MTIEEVKSGLARTDKGEVLQSTKNCIYIFKNDPVLENAIKFNELTERIDIVKEVGWKRRTRMFCDSDMAHIRYRFESIYGIKSDKHIETALTIVSEEESYHPIKDILNGLVWDKTPRMCDALSYFLGADKCDYTYEALKLFMMGAINRIFHPGSKFDVMLCLVGGQGLGKSTFFRLLAIDDEYFSDDIKKIDDEKIFSRLQGHWIIEMSEMLAMVNAKSIEELKSFITRCKDTYRTPYDKQPKDRLRQCVFAGTTNTMDFLPLDRTGNRRFIPILCNECNAQQHILDDEDFSRDYIKQLWAEAMDMYLAGEYQLTFVSAIKEYLQEHQAEFMPEDTKAALIANYLEVNRPEFISSMELYHNALGKTDHPQRWEVREINSIMNNTIEGYIKTDTPHQTKGFNRQRGWLRDPNYDWFVDAYDSPFD